MATAGVPSHSLLCLLKFHEDTINVSLSNVFANVRPSWNPRHVPALRLAYGWRRSRHDVAYLALIQRNQNRVGVRVEAPFSPGRA
jgi:hypothetical protein